MCSSDLKEELKKEFDALKQKYTGTVYPSSESYQDPYDELIEERMTLTDKKRFDELKKLLKDLHVKYGYDERTSFDKLMDTKWGIIAQIAVNTLFVILGEFTGGATWGMLMDGLFNTGIGLYQWSRDQQEEAVMSFVFAGLPFMKNLWKIGRAHV